MKKLQTFVLCTLLLTWLSIPTMAAERRYTWKELEEVRASISWEEASAAGVMAYGIGEDSVGVLIDMSNLAAGNYMEKLTGQFGDKVSFEDGTGCKIVYTPGSAGTEWFGVDCLRPRDRESPWLWLLTAVLAALAGFFFLRARTLSVCQMADGRVVTTPTCLTAARVEAAVQKSKIAPSSGLDRRILAEIDKI